MVTQIVFMRELHCQIMIYFLQDKHGYVLYVKTWLCTPSSLASQRVNKVLAALAFPGSLLKKQNLVPTPDLLKKDLFLVFVHIAKFEKNCLIIHFIYSLISIKDPLCDREYPRYQRYNREQNKIPALMQLPACGENEE